MTGIPTTGTRAARRTTPPSTRRFAPERRGHGGYVDNVSTAWAPRYWEEMVRNMLVSSAVTPGVMLMAEDHSGWGGVTTDPDDGGFGFEASWYADFYHHLVGDTEKGSDYAKLIHTAGLGDDRPLAMDYFAGALQAMRGGRAVVHHESHDEAGNGRLTDRTIRVAVTGEQAGAERQFLYGHVLDNREDLVGLRHGGGRFLFGFYRQLIRLRRSRPGLRRPEIDVVFVHNDHRLLVFHRWGSGQDFLVVASLPTPFDRPSYVFHADRIPGGRWREIFNSDASAYGGDNVGNAGGVIDTAPGTPACVVPANAVILFERSAEVAGRQGPR